MNKNVNRTNNIIIEHISPLALLEHELMLFVMDKRNVNKNLNKTNCEILE